MRDLYSSRPSDRLSPILGQSPSNQILILKENDLYSPGEPIINLCDLRPRSRMRLQEYAAHLLQRYRVCTGLPEGTPKDDRIRISNGGHGMYTPIMVKKAVWFYAKLPTGMGHAILSACKSGKAT